MTDHKLKVHQIPTNTPQKELHHMDLQETIVLRIKREREESIQLLTTDPKVYKELLTHHRRGTNGSSEPLRDGVQIGSGGSGLCGGWINISSTPLGFWEYQGIYRAKRRSGGHLRWAQPTRARPGFLCSPRGTPRCCQGPLRSFWPIKNLGKVTCICTPFDIDFMRCKKHGKTATGTWHYVNRLVPKNDIKSL